jgi:hypothetical protein
MVGEINGVRVGNGSPGVGVNVTVGAARVSVGNSGATAVLDGNGVAE